MAYLICYCRVWRPFRNIVTTVVLVERGRFFTNSHGGMAPHRRTNSGSRALTGVGKIEEHCGNWKILMRNRPGA
jgi:hypothetical protein